MNKLKNVFLATALIVSTIASAQLKTPQPSPSASVTQTVGLTDVTIDYSRPGMKGRAIFGDLVPFDKIWRTGANKATAISFNDDVSINGNDVKAGKYAVFTIPGKTEWTIIVNSNTELWGAGDYKKEEDVARFTVKSTQLNDAVESLTIDFSNFNQGEAQVNLSWENTRVSFPISTKAGEQVEKQIKTMLIDGPSAGTYYGAARYYLDNDKDMEQALAWINTAIEKRPSAFWYMHQKAKIQGKLGQTKEAIATAEKSMKMAGENEDGDYGYVANNKKLIEELKAK